MRRIVIDPVTRLEGHGKIAIFLNDEGDVANCYFQIPELRGFERFCIGRLAEDMNKLTSRLCGCTFTSTRSGGTVRKRNAIGWRLPSSRPRYASRRA